MRKRTNVSQPATGIWKVRKVNLDESAGEARTTQFWVLIQSRCLSSTRTPPLLTFHTVFYSLSRPQFPLLSPFLFDFSSSLLCNIFGLQFVFESPYSRKHPLSDNSSGAALPSVTLICRASISHVWPHTRTPFHVTRETFLARKRQWISPLNRRKCVLWAT
jgi:hypothetical protein